MQKQHFYNVDAMDQGIQRELADGLSTRIFPGEQAMISVVRIAADATGDLHAHPQEQWGFCFRGFGIRHQGGEDIPVQTGDFWRTPGMVEHGFTAGPQGAVIYDLFAPPREEYKKTGRGFS